MVCIPWELCLLLCRKQIRFLLSICVVVGDVDFVRRFRITERSVRMLVEWLPKVYFELKTSNGEFPPNIS